MLNNYNFGENVYGFPFIIMCIFIIVILDVRHNTETVLRLRRYVTSKLYSQHLLNLNKNKATKKTTDLGTEGETRA